MRNKNRQHSTILRLEILEARLAPAVVTVAYPNASYNSPYVAGLTYPGIYTPKAFYVVPSTVAGSLGTPREIDLDPVTVMSSPSNTFKDTLDAAFGKAYTIRYNDSPGDLEITVKTYMAQAKSSIDFKPPPNQGLGGQVGALIDVASTILVNVGTYHWIQVISTNADLLGGMGPVQPYLDNNKSTVDPYFPKKDQRGFTDFTTRNQIQADIGWHAETYLAVEEAGKNLTIYKDGFEWGWSLKDRPANNTLDLSLTSNKANVANLFPVTFTAKLTQSTFIGSPVGPPAPPSGPVEFVNVTSGKFLGYGLINPILGGWQATLDCGGLSITDGAMQTIRATYGGNAYWNGVSTTFVQKVGGACVSLNSSTPLTTLGQPVTFTATVTDPADATIIPTGVVSFFDGTALLGTGTLDATGHAALSSSSLSLGVHTIVASYGGDATFDPATGSTSVEVDPSGSISGHAFLDSNGNGIQDSGEAGLANVTMTLAGPSNQTVLTDASGNYLFANVLLGSYAVSAAGPPNTALEGYSQGGTPSAGSLSLTADHPDADLEAAFISAMASTTTSLTVNTPTPTVGDALTLTVSVAPTVGWGNPSGTVQFFDGTTLLGAASLSATSLASLTTTALAAGTHDLIAVYTGDPTYNGSTSADVPATVQPPAQQAPASVALSSSSQLAGVGQFVTFSAVVTSTAGGMPSGTVTFLDGSTPLGTATLSQGACSVSTSALLLGVHNITAVYNGDASYAGATSPALAETIEANTQVMLTESAQTSGPGWPVTFTATVSPSSLGVTLSGTVSFYDNGVLIQTIVLSQGMAGMQSLLTTSSLAVGSHTITATYNGDANDSPSSMWVTFTVMTM